jgi:HEAT repeat protein
MIERKAGEMAPSSPKRHMAITSAAAIDALAVAILIHATSLASPLEGLVAVALHIAAVMLLLVLHGGRASRRRLSFAAALTVPVVGVAIAAAAMESRGRRGALVWRHRDARRRRAPLKATLERLGSALSPCDALGPGDEEQRRSALSALSRRNDPEAISVLRWAAAGRDPDLALSAALVLDVIRERAERRAWWMVPAEARRAAH